MRIKYGIEHNSNPSLELTTMVGCPLMCSFCPQKTLKSNYGKQEKYLKISDLKKILKKIPSNTEIHFSGMSEPWANPDCTKMLKIVLEMGFNVAIYTTIYGMAPNDAKLVVKLIERYNNQIVTICLHLPDANKNMKGWKYSKDYEESFNILSGANVDCGILKMTMDGSGEIHPDIKHLTNINHDFKGHTRADSLDVAQVKDQPIVQTPHHYGKITCASTPFYDKNVLLPNGDVVLCCMDYSLKHIIGNLIKQNYAEIFNTKEFLMIVETNENSGFSKCSICKSCDNVTPIGFKSKIKKFIPKPIRKFI